jgi:arsenate reductase
VTPKLPVDFSIGRVLGNAATVMTSAPSAEGTDPAPRPRPPAAGGELVDVLARLGLEPWHITRTQEPAAAEAGLAELPRDDEHRDAWLDALAAHPSLIQRPILTADDGTTVVGRDPAELGRVIDAEHP